MRAFGVDVFWALTAPAIAVVLVTATVTLRRRRIDMIGLLVLVELVATITLSLATHSPRIAAVREPVYVLIGGVFCLATLFCRTPFSHVSTSSIATFGDPKRETAFEQAWRNVPQYRMWQRLLTAAFGLIMIVTAIIRAYILYSTPDSQIAHAVDVSNILSFAMIAALVVVSGILIRPPRKIIAKLTEQM